MKTLLDKDGLDRRPHRITNEFWYYEMSNGLWCYSDSIRKKLLGVIPWRSIRASLKRLDTAKEKATK